MTAKFILFVWMVRNNEPIMCPFKTHVVQVFLTDTFENEIKPEDSNRVLFSADLSIHFLSNYLYGLQDKLYIAYPHTNLLH